MVKIVSIDDDDLNLTELVDDLESRQDHLLITRKGRPSAVLLSVEEYEALNETLEILQDEDPLGALRGQLRGHEKFELQFPGC